jgi:hypothetical protein
LRIFDPLGINGNVAPILAADPQTLPRAAFALWASAVKSPSGCRFCFPRPDYEGIQKIDSFLP